ncbi:Mur ligase family protein [Streptomyces caniscabiei]|uniref:Mur ligase family protein n=1 Tax=Streptomyces caniscabiei TaxID=2746961 RepID=UPI0029A95214|nr:Mur ligase family protein [Streptomyces caniscabiei]MDX2775797.1 Mur ligase family protein [Streptomyces caniscabiei]
MFKKIIQKKLERYVVKYFKKHPEVKLIVVAGSVGKTSTKRAVATLLSQRYRVAMHPGNHNTHMSVPLAVLGIDYPGNLKSLGAWLSVFAAARKRIKDPTGTDVIIAEIGADHPGDIAHFGTYLKPYIAVITAVTPEHMEYFNDIETVAKEELTAANFSQLAIINRDDIDGRFASFLTNTNVDTYGTTGVAEYRFETQDFEVVHGYRGQVIAPEFEEEITATIKVVGEHSLRPVMGAVAVAAKMGLRPNEIAAGLALIKPVPGRMNILEGIDGTIIIDDSYNSSPVAASSALQALYSLQAPERIVIMGSMNELGVVSAVEHEKLGALCDPLLLSWVITVGEEAEKYLAPAARARGCQVKTFRSAIDAGAFARSVAEPGAIILVKGSEGDIFTEEAVKVLCVMSDDAELVRQSPEWMARKDAFFSKFS